MQKNVLNPKFSMKSITYISSLPIFEDMLKQKYLKDYLSIRESAKEFSYSINKVRLLLLKYKIPLRVPLNCHYKDKSRTYDKKKINGRTSDHKRELKTTDTIRNLYKQRN